MIRDMAGMTAHHGAHSRSVPDRGYTDRQRAAFGLPFFVRFCPAQAGGLGGKRLCRARLPSRIFACGRALTGLESSVKGHRKKFFEIFFRKFFRRPPKNVMAQSCRKCAG